MNLRSISSLFGFLAVSLVLTAGSAIGQVEKKLSAREIFYSPPVPQSPPGAPSATGKTAVVHANRTQEKKPITTTEIVSGSSPSSSGAVPQGNNAETQTIPVSYSSEDAVPLGLRYSLLKREGSESVEVDPGSIFRSGDKIRLRIDVNTAGYLYIINRGSSGNWNPLFPSAKIANGDNRVQKGTQYEIPSGYVFTFDEQPGTERLFIVFSRQPVSDLEELIYSLSDGQKPKTSPRPDASKILLAQANIQDGMIDRLRNIYSRDLIIEKVDETKAPSPSAPANEKAVYVVNPSRSADSRLVADVALIHK
jgi:Domain of unknown function (DUF4384)